MKDIVLLSEIHPYGAQQENFNPLNQAYNWFNLLSPSDVEKVQAAGSLPFDEAIELINRRCLEKGLILVIRDWSHLDFFAAPFLSEPSYLLSTSMALENKFDVSGKAIVRHPIDQWLSLRTLDILQGKINLDFFLKGYLNFGEYAVKKGFIRYEDFTMKPEEEIEKLCNHLSLPYDKSFIYKWDKYRTITGDTNSERGYAREIKSMPRREMEEGLIGQFEANENYWRSIKILGYGHPF